MFRCSSLLIALTLTAVPGLASAQHVFLKVKDGEWSLQGMTRPNTLGPLPTVGSIECTVSRPGLSVTIDRNSRVVVDVTAFPGPDQPDAFNIMNISALTFDGQRYAALAIPVSNSNEFLDVTYPPADPDRIKLSVFTGYLGVRASEADPWLSGSYLLTTMLKSKTMIVDYATGNVSKRATVPLAGLGAALTACQQATRSPEAYKLGAPAK